MRHLSMLQRNRGLGERTNLVGVRVLHFRVGVVLMFFICIMMIRLLQSIGMTYSLQV